MHTSTRADHPTASEPISTTPCALPERNARLIALLDSFDDSDPAQPRQDFAALQAGIDDARPGQRRIFEPH